MVDDILRAHSLTGFVLSTSPHPAWPCLVNPHRFAEVRHAIKKDASGLLLARGEKWHEGALHWVGMSDPGAWIDLMAAGGDPNVIDNLGRTPLDWVNDRLYMGTVAPHQRLGTPARERIRVATIKQAPVIWASGGRPGVGSHSLNPVKLWLETGLWDLLSMASADKSLWRNWEGGRHALHSWVPMADLKGATSLFDRILSCGIDVDLPDNEGRSAMWHAVDMWIKTPGSASAPRTAIELLRKHGADPDLDQGATAPSSLLVQKGISPELQGLISSSIGM